MSIASYDNTVFIPDGPVSSMIFLPVLARALESRKRNSLLTDHKAVEIYDRIIDPYSFLDAQEESLAHYTIICKTLCFDRLIRDFTFRHPNGTVINIGCGLDSAFERLNSKTIRWYDLDLPNIIELRKCFFLETELRKHIPASFINNEWTGSIICDDSLLIYASGVFYYYDEKTIERFFSHLSVAFPSCEIIFNVTSPLGVRAANRPVQMKRVHDEKLKWGLVDFRSILGWNPRMRFLGKYRIFHQSYRVPLRFRIPGLVYDALSIENVLHYKIRYNYKKLPA